MAKKIFNGLIEEVELATQLKKQNQKFNNKSSYSNYEDKGEVCQVNSRTFNLNGVYYTVELNNGSSVNFVKSIDRIAKVFPSLTKGKSVNSKTSKKVLAYAAKCPGCVYSFINQHLNYIKTK